MTKNLKKINLIKTLPVKTSKAIFAASFVLAFAINFHAQDLPSKIRGYKVYRTEISIGNSAIKPKADNELRVEFDFDQPKLADVSLSGITLSLGGELTVFGQSGTVDFISFEEFTVNNIPVELAEYKDSFDFLKGQTFRLKQPVEIFISSTRALNGIIAEKRESKEKWKVSGKVFIFGQFRKFGFRFKRVIPVKVEMEIENPIRQKFGASN